MRRFDPGRFVSRKFLAWVVIVALATVLVWFSKIGDSAWQNTVIITTAVYVGGNVAQKVLRK